MYRLMISAAAVALLASVQMSSAEDLKAGADLFNDNCAICHGGKGQGYPKEVVPDGAVRIKKLAGDFGLLGFRGLQDGRRGRQGRSWSADAGHARIRKDGTL